MDYLNDEEIDSALEMVPWWARPETATAPFADDDREVMQQLAHREYVLASPAVIHCVLADILAAFVYDHRTTLGEPTVESGWTISTLAASLSWLWLPSSMRDVAVSFARRAVAYPLYRHFGLARRCLEDSARIILSGRRVILKCLLAARRIFARDDLRRPAVELFLDDYCVWVMSAPSEGLRAAGTELAQAVSTLQPAHLGFDLPVLEEEAMRRLMEEGDEDEDDGGSGRD